MASGSDAEILEKIADLKADISTVNTTLNTHVKPSNNVTDKQFEDGKKEIIDQVKKGKEEQKTRWEAFMEAIGIKNFFEAFKQLDGLTVTILVVGATLALLKDRVLNYGKLLNGLVEKVTGRIFSVGQGGAPTLRTRADTESDQAVSINPTGVAPERLNSLKLALSAITPEIVKFNDAITRMKSPRQIKQIAKAVETLKNALTPNPADDVKNLATAIGRLNKRLDKYDPQKLPKAQTLRETAAAARDLSSTAETLRSRFVQLSNGFGTAARALGTTN
ncbi:hypothetical protein [Streptomyces sp. NPDC002845]